MLLDFHFGTFIFFCFVRRRDGRFHWIYLNSTLLALIPYLWLCILLHLVHVYLKSVFFVTFFPVIFQLVTAGFEYLPRLPVPLALPLNLALKIGRAHV